MRSVSESIGAVVGNNMLDRAEGLVAELKVKDHLRKDARQEAVLAMLEGRNPEQAIRRFCTGERSMGMTGGRTRPTVLRLTHDECDQIPNADTPDAAERIESSVDKLVVAAAVMVTLTRRQLTMVELAKQGWTHDEIAGYLNMAQSSVTEALGRIAKRSQELLAKTSNR